VVALALAVLGAAGCNVFDQAQVPVISVGKGLRPEISWTPELAYQLTVYEGDRDGNGFGAIWSASVGGGYENRLRSPVTYGVPPAQSEVAAAPPLELGRTYTVTVFRKDERGSGEGFFNTRHRYVGLRTFIAAE
jgi:hypothetical protein